MNALGLQLLWVAIQVLLVGLACVALRRLVRGQDTSITLAGLGVACVLLVLAWLPMPSWWDRWQPAAVRPPDTAASLDTVAAPRPAGVNAEHPQAARAAAPQPPAASTPRSTWVEWMSWALVAEAAATSAASPAARWSWPAALALTCLVAVGIGILQFAVGLWAVARVRRRSQPLTDKNLSELLAVTSAELDVVRPVKLYESQQIVTAATVGWRHPAILLPPEWRLWSPAQQRALLAHELAHIQRGDYFTSLVAQLGVALQFYHPVMHWLGRRLRLEQELAADATAAQLLGGQQAYLYSLVELALEQSDRTLGWPARNFLPTRGTFMRRIEMLRSSSSFTPRRGTLARAAACGALVLMGVLASGLRSPLATTNPVIAQESSLAPNQASGEFNLQYIPNDAAALVMWRPAEVLASPALKDVAGQLVEQIREDARLDLTKVEQMTLVMQRAVTPPAEPGVILRSSEPAVFEEFVAKYLPGAQPTKIGPFTLYKAEQPRQPAYFFPDDRTLIMGPFDSLANFLVGERGSPKLTSSAIWSAVSRNPVAAIADMQWVAEQIPTPPSDSPRTPAVAFARQLAPFAPLYTDTQLAAAGLKLGETTQLHLLTTSASEEKSERVLQTANAGLVLLRNLLEQVRAQTAKMRAEDKVLVHSLLSLAETALQSVAVKRDAATFELTMAVPLQQATVLGVIAPALEAQRAAARRAIMTNHLKQIGLALHHYVSDHGRFPPPVLTGPDGKTKYSWRVAILPYLEQKQLYDQYDFNEPWDSPKNRKVLEQMPAVFRAPHKPQGTIETAYVALVAPEAIFNDSGKGMEMAEIHDGTSNTAIIVDTEQVAIPWTKPEDLNVDVNELPTFTSWTENAVAVLFADGSVRMIHTSIDKNVLRALITARGGEPVPLP